jgi:medium-chain acyl-[acyl-carrier-protein] hydrolase
MLYPLEENFRITSADADFQRKLKISSLINMFIQIAWQHAEQMGYGVNSMDNSGLAWMLSRLHVRIDYLPCWNEVLTLNTWPKGTRRLFYLRDFTVKDENNRFLAKATSEWLMIDKNARRPRLKDPESEVFTVNKNRHALDTEVPSLKAVEETSDVFHFISRYSDLDLNRHLTATKYIDWMFDTFELDYLEFHSCNELIINFIHEVPFREKVNLMRKYDSTDNSFQFESLSETGDKAFFRGKLFFTK